MSSFDYPRSIAVKALDQILNNDQFSNDVLNQLLSDPKLSILDRKFITALVYGVLDYLPLLDEMIINAADRPLKRIDPYILNILRLGVWQIKFAEKIPQSAAVDESVKLTSYFNKSFASGFVNAVLRQVIRNPLRLKKKQQHLKYGMSAEIFGLYKKWFGEQDAVAIAESYLSGEQKISVIYLGPKEQKDNWLDELNSLGIATEPGILVEQAIILHNLTTDIKNLPGYDQGYFYVQDESSMLVSEIMQLSPNAKVLDACAGLGGKSFSLLANHPDLEIIALEPNRDRFRGLDENIRRLKLSQINSLAIDLQNFTIEQLKTGEQFEQIILDVPCSGLGVIKHKPEIKLNLSYEQIIEYPKIQMDLLEHAASLVKPGGKLLYSTCTINPAENELLIEQFLNTESGSEYKATDLSDYISNLDTKYEAELRTGLSKYGLTIRPDLIPVDGFFISYLTRIS